MAVKIRLSRIGKKHVPFYRIVAVDGRAKRDGAFLEDLGTYNALESKLVTFKPERIEYWLSVGAVATDSFAKILKVHKHESRPAEQVVAAPQAAKKPATRKKTTTAKAE